MNLKKRTKLAFIRALVVLTLIFLVSPSMSFGQGFRWPILKEKQREEIRKKIDRHEVTPEELTLWIADQSDRAAEAEYTRRNQPKEGFLKSIYKLLTENPMDIQTADVIAGVSDRPNPDNPAKALGGPGTWAPEPPPPSQKSLIQIFEEDRAGKPSAIEIIRAKRDARRAMKALEVAKKLAQAEKMTTEVQAARASAAQESTGCFPRDIRVVMADGTVKPIAKVKEGDRVMTYDIGYDKTAGKTVLRAYSVKSNHLYTINGDFKTTGGERLLTPSGWKPLSSLGRQDFVHVNGRMTGVETIDYQRVELTTYNLEVDDTHNFYIQTQCGHSYLVHNGGGGGK